MLCHCSGRGQGPHGGGPQENEKTEAGAKADDDYWLHAEADGDADFLERLLLGYRSIGPYGVVLSRERIIAGTAKNKGSDDAKEKSTVWRKANPPETAMVRHGDVAVVSFYDSMLEPYKGVPPSDILIYENSGRHSVYSQYSTVKSQ